MKCFLKWRMAYAIGMLTVTTLFSCQNIDTESRLSTPLKTYRLDRDIADIDTLHIAEGLTKLKTKYPTFLDFYLDTLMGLGIQGHYNDSNPGIKLGMHDFLTHPDFRGLFDTIAQHFPNTTAIDEDLNKGFGLLKKYYPKYPIPEIVYLNSNLNNYAAFTYDTLAIGIGLDMYLGANYPYYASVGIPQYLSQRLTPDYVPVNVFQSVYRAMHPFVMDNKTLLDMMLQKGKEQYFLSKVIPFVDEHKRMGYTPEQLAWCEASEAAIYHFFIEKQLLYSTHMQSIIRYVMDGPTAAGMPPESPGNISNWLGYRMVKAYADKHSEMSLEQIVAPMDAQKFLQESKYKPK